MRQAKYLCLSRDVLEGRYLLCAAFDRPLVAWRKDGELRAVPNICQHRGFPFASGAGELPIKCPYHGLVAIAGNEESKVRVQELNGVAIVRDEGSQLSVHQEMLRVFDLIGTEFGSVETRVRAPYELWMQNTSDVNHLKYVHPSFSKTFDHPVEPDDVWIAEDNSASSYRLRVNPYVSTKYGNLLKREIGSHFYHLVVGPNLSVTSFMDVFLSVEVASPTAEGCLVLTRFFTARGMELPQALLRVAMQRNKVVLEEDRDIVERWALGRPWKTPNAWLPGESRVRAYYHSRYTGQWP